MGIVDIVNKVIRRESEAEKLYKELNTAKYQNRPFKTEDLDEDMSIVNEVIWEYWKPRYLMDHRTKCAYEFMNREQCLVTVKLDDIDWDSFTNVDKDAVRRAKELDFHFPSFVLKYQNDVAQVRWQLNPDGMYYMDEDGYGMTDDVEVNIYGFIDRKGKVLSKFRYIRKDEELKEMRFEAEQIILRNKVNQGIGT